MTPPPSRVLAGGRDCRAGENNDEKSAAVAIQRRAKRHSSRQTMISGGKMTRKSGIPEFPARLSNRVPRIVISITVKCVPILATLPRRQLLPGTICRVNPENVRTSYRFIDQTEITPSRRQAGLRSGNGPRWYIDRRISHGHTESRRAAQQLLQAGSPEEERVAARPADRPEGTGHLVGGTRRQARRSRSPEELDQVNDPLISRTAKL